MFRSPGLVLAEGINRSYAQLAEVLEESRERARVGQASSRYAYQQSPPRQNWPLTAGVVAGAQFPPLEQPADDETIAQVTGSSSLDRCVRIPYQIAKAIWLLTHASPAQET